MATRPGGIRTLALALASALVLFGLVLAAFFMLSGSSDRKKITLPDGALASAPAQSDEVEEDSFLTVGPDNVAAVVATLARPASYHQTLTITTVWPDESAARTAELWVSGDVTRVDVTGTDTTRSVLTDGQTAYVWYSGDSQSACFSLDEDMGADSLIGVPTYERILSADGTIEDAGFVQLDDLDGRSCIFAQIAEDGYVDRYWVDVTTGLLCRATTSREQTLIYQLREESSEQLLATDEVFATAFTLPDGTAPFSSEQ